MKRLVTPLILLFLLLAACADNTSEVGTGSSADDAAIGNDDAGESTNDEQPIPVEPDGGIGDGAEPLPAVELDEHVITDADIVDPKVTTPSEVVVNPDDDTELWVRFVGGDPNCTAATAIVLTETPDRIDVELTTGITTDAMSRSCLADTFNLRVDVSLNESAAGKTIAWTSASGDEPVLVTPDLSTDDFLGLTEDEAREIADANTLTWRTVRVDGEWFAVTEDYNPGRLNFEIDNNVITKVTLG